MTVLSTSRGLRRPMALIVLAVLTSVFGSLYAISWVGSLSPTMTFRWPFSFPALSPTDLNASYSPTSFPSSSDLDAADGPPISIIIIWKNDVQPYMSNFLQSVLANARSLEVLWVGVKWAHEDACFDPLELVEDRHRVEANVRLLCLSEDEYWEMHRDYFCERWNCSDVERKLVLDAMIERQQRDYQHSFFRLWRGYVFRHHLNPGARWWGWADPDTFLGNFDTQFPWDAEAFDVFVPASPHTLLYLRGHLCFFRTGTNVEDKLNSYPNLISPDAYLEKHKVGQYTAMEEAEFSAFIFRSNISFLLSSSSLVDIPLGAVALNTPTFASLKGVYMPYSLPPSLPDWPEIPVLGLPGECASCPRPTGRRPTFSEEGVTRPVSLRRGAYEGDLWFPSEWATEYLPALHPPDEKGWTVFVGRGGWEGGPEGVWERREPPPPSIDVPVLSHLSNAKPQPTQTVPLREGLYIHFFHQKHADWFPGPRLEEGGVLMSVFMQGGEVWQAGKRVWRSGQ
ncbi:hypothetical protein DACRYDRAFT_110231 [Dacryopinax primogenitus]|uniref:Uncharacterized protein n=1 Tax=Dacryopinax primogenitus (strain DJM 731) TaxID=1858805 RepID=M5FTV7_DACPD|nr:uncharacterized protein DACRYDRAFT_110231 [Dacryopinax primogenitus]EJT98894.1 hypothetical protein DACRYDRAFT_110231 [Dacryopinax primogenitus]